MKYRFSQFALSLLVVASLSQAQGQDRNQPPSKPLDVYLLIGQSNMAGRAPFDADEAKPLKDTYLLNDKGQWEPATNPLNRHSSIRKDLKMQKLSPGYTFAQTMLAGKTGNSIGLVVNAKGGSKIDEWAKGTKFYTEALRRTREAQKNGTLRGILWHQGESDDRKPDGYLEKLEKLITDLRKDLGIQDLPFVAGQVKDVPKINQQIAELPETVKHTAYVSSEGLTTSDRWHFDAKSMKELGKRYAEAMLKLQD